MSKRIDLSRNAGLFFLGLMDATLERNGGDPMATRFREELARALQAKDRAPSKKLATTAKRAKWSDHKEETRQIREACGLRSGGNCEACGSMLSDFNPAHMDHFFKRAKVPQAVENCWLICLTCDRAVTDNNPSRARWLNTFYDHCEHHGYQVEAQRALTDLNTAVTKHALVSGRGEVGP